MCPDHGRERDRCSICGGVGSIWTQNPHRQLLRCGSCGFAWVPQGVARTAAGQSIYEGDEPVFFTDAQRDYYRDEVTTEAARAKLAWVARFVPAGRALLDVGANFGHFLREAQQQYDAVGIEPSAAVVAWGREHLGVHLETGSIGDEMLAYQGRFAAVTLFDVIEHLEDPRDALQRCHRYLTPGGHLFITTPDTSAPVARLLGSHWYYIDLLEHVSLFSAANLTRLLTECGFRVVERRTIGRRYRVSYIERRLRDLARDSVLLRAASTAALPLRLARRARVTLNLGDVTAVTAVAA